MNHLIKQTTIVTSLALACSAAMAAGTLNADIVSIDGDQVTIAVKDQLPEWIAQDAKITALGWQTTVKSVDGNKFTLSLSPSKTARAKPNTSIVINEIPQQERIGC